MGAECANNLPWFFFFFFFLVYILKVSVIRLHGITTDPEREDHTSARNPGVDDTRKKNFVDSLCELKKKCAGIF